MSKKSSRSTAMASNMERYEDEDGTSSYRLAMNRETRVRPDDYWITTRNSGGSVDEKLIVARLGKLFSMNRIASMIWELLDGTNTESDIAGKISKEFQLPQDQALTELRGFLRMFGEGEMVSITH
jgi:hypothetical protein